MEPVNTHSSTVDMTNVLPSSVSGDTSEALVESSVPVSFFLKRLELQRTRGKEFPHSVAALIEWYERECDRSQRLTIFLDHLYAELRPILMKLSSEKLHDAHVDVLNEDMKLFRSSSLSPASAVSGSDVPNPQGLVPPVVKAVEPVGVTKGTVVSGSVIQAAKQPQQSSVGHVTASVVRGSVKTAVVRAVGAPTPTESKMDSIVPSRSSPSASPLLPSSSSLPGAIEAASLRVAQRLLDEKQREAVFMEEQLERFQQRQLRVEEELHAWRQGYQDLMQAVLSCLTSCANPEELSSALSSLHRTTDILNSKIRSIEECERQIENVTLQKEEAHYQYAHAKQRAEKQEKEIQLLQERAKILEGQIERISTMNAQPRFTPPVTPLRSEEMVGLENQVKELQKKLNIRNQQVTQNALIKTKLETYVSELQNENTELHRSLRSLKKETDQRALDFATASTDPCLSEGFRRLEVECLHLKRAFTERKERYAVESLQWKEREHIYVTALRHLRQRISKWAMEKLIYEELERQREERQAEETATHRRETSPSQDRQSECLTVQESCPDVPQDEALTGATSSHVKGKGMEEQSTSLSTKTSRNEESWIRERHAMEHQLEETKAQHRAETKKLKTLIHELQQIIISLKKKRSDGSFLKDHERSTPDACPISDSAAPSRSLSGPQHPSNIEVEELKEEIKKMKSDFSTLQKKHHSVVIELQSIRKTKPVTPSTSHVRPLPGVSQGTSNVKSVQLLLQQTLLEKMELEERLSRFEQR